MRKDTHGRSPPSTTREAPPAPYAVPRWLGAWTTAGRLPAAHVARVCALYVLNRSIASVCSSQIHTIDRGGGSGGGTQHPPCVRAVPVIVSSCLRSPPPDGLAESSSSRRDEEEREGAKPRKLKGHAIAQKFENRFARNASGLDKSKSIESMNGVLLAFLFVGRDETGPVVVHQQQHKHKSTQSSVGSVGRFFVLFFGFVRGIERPLSPSLPYRTRSSPSLCLSDTSLFSFLSLSPRL